MFTKETVKVTVKSTKTVPITVFNDDTFGYSYYYDKKDRVLYCRTSPNRPWEPHPNSLNRVLQDRTPEQSIKYLEGVLALLKDAVHPTKTKKKVKAKK